jgi:hypothetical protein
MEVRPQDDLPQGTVKAGTGPLSGSGPRDFDDLVTHTGEARGTADTARHSLQPDAPTVGAAGRDLEIEEDLAATQVQIPSSSTGPD